MWPLSADSAQPVLHLRGRTHCGAMPQRARPPVARRSRPHSPCARTTPVLRQHPAHEPCEPASRATSSAASWPPSPPHRRRRRCRRRRRRLHCRRLDRISTPAASPHHRRAPPRHIAAAVLLLLLLPSSSSSCCCCCGRLCRHCRRVAGTAQPHDGARRSFLGRFGGGAAAAAAARSARGRGRDHAVARRRVPVALICTDEHDVTPFVRVRRSTRGIRTPKLTETEGQQQQ